MIDRYDAPEGMVAIRKISTEGHGCFGCSFIDKGIEKQLISIRKCCDRRYCLAENRKDKEHVIFITRAEFESMLMQEIRGFYQVDDFSIYRDGVNIRIDAQNKT